MIRCFLLLLLISSPLAVADARFVIHLADYLANDYAGAVSEDGKLLSEGEYAEQVEFALASKKEAATDPVLKSNGQLQQKLDQLYKAISLKQAPSIVVPIAREVQRLVLTSSGLAMAPKEWPNYDRARELYTAHCLNCHGIGGRGDGPDGKDLDPSPANFHDAERALILSPFAAFNTIRLGVPGTGMLAHPDLSDEDVWSLAFYVKSLRFGEPRKSRGPILAGTLDEHLLEKAASLGDKDLGEFARDPSLVPAIRLYDPEKESADYLLKAETHLNGSLKSFESGDFVAAEKLSLEAYFQGLDPIENKISANDPAAVTRLEEKMAAFRKAIKDRESFRVRIVHGDLIKEFHHLRALLAEQKVTPALAFVSGFSIILREGFEAVLVILAILGVGRASGSRLVIGTIHSGWLASLGLGIGAWFVSAWLINLSGVGREVMEAITSFFAVFVLIYVGFWMHRQTEIHRWKEFINVRVKNLTQTKNLLGLFLLSFVVTFREVIETVLFLRTFYTDSGEGVRAYLFGGVAVAFMIVLVVSVLISKFRTKIPLQKFFAVSSVLMIALATILAGKGIHALQEAGILSMNLFPMGLRIELLGIFPSWETVVSQLIILTTSILIWKSASRRPVKS